MAFALRIVARTKNGHEVKIEPSWWDKDELRSTHNFTMEVNDYYLDYFLFVNLLTFQDIMESQEKYRTKGICEHEDWITDDDEKKAKLDELVQNLQEDSIIKIWIYEWESGLD